MPRRPALPVSWVNWAGVEQLVPVAGELRQLVDDHATCREVDAECQRLGGEDHPHESLGEAELYGLLERRDLAGMMTRHPSFESLEPGRAVEESEVAGIETGKALLCDRPDPQGLLVVGESRPGAHDRGGRFVTAPAAEHEPDHREELACLEHVEQLETVWGSPGTVRSPSPVLALTSQIRVEAGAFGVRTIVDQCGDHMESITSAVTHGVQIGELDRSGRLDDHPVSPLTLSSHPATSSVFDTVADKQTSRTWGGRWRMTSSQTGPRYESSR